MSNIPTPTSPSQSTQRPNNASPPQHSPLQQTPSIRASPYASPSESFAYRRYSSSRLSDTRGDPEDDESRSRPDVDDVVRGSNGDSAKILDRRYADAEAERAQNRQPGSSAAPTGGQPSSFGSRWGGGYNNRWRMSFGSSAERSGVAGGGRDGEMDESAIEESPKPSNRTLASQSTQYGARNGEPASNYNGRELDEDYDEEDEDDEGIEEDELELSTNASSKRPSMEPESGPNLHTRPSAAPAQRRGRKTNAQKAKERGEPTPPPSSRKRRRESDL